MKHFAWFAVFGLFCGACSKETEAIVEGTRVGNLAPEILGEDASGKKIRLSDYRGNVVLLSFWASWCGPCVKMIPHEKKIVSKFSGSKFAILGINADKDRETLAKVQNQLQMSWPSVWDGIGYVGREWNIEFLPVMIVIDGQGIIRFNSKSIMDDLDSLDELGSRIEKEVEKALKTLEVGKAKK
ncbi:MAG: Thiol-disulfide oxidoreductase ResA [Planctomycetota bacterium]